MNQIKRWAVLLAFSLPLMPVTAGPKTDALVGKSAPPFTLPQLGGKTVSLAGLKGQVALLNFWDFGCPSCNQEVKHLERLHQKFGKQGLRVVGIAALNPEAAEMKRFMQDHATTYPVVVDRKQSVARKFGIAAHPATVIVDRKGVVRFVHTGFLKGDEVTLETSVKALLAGEKIALR